MSKPGKPKGRARKAAERESSTHKKSAHVLDSSRAVGKTHNAHKSAPKRYGKRFCPNCGSEIKGGGEFCSECTHPDFKFKDINVKICNSCHSYFHKNKWVHFKDINIAFRNIAQTHIHAKVAVKQMPKEMKEKIAGYKAGIKENLFLPITHHTQTFEIPASLEVTLCPKCSKKGSQYFEGILQLRNSTDEILDFVRSDIRKQSKKGIYINKEVPVEKYSTKDIDVYITNQSYAKTLAEKLHKQFGAKIKKNAKLFSKDWQTAKNLYRLNVLIVFPAYRKGDVIKVDANLFQIVSIKEDIHVMNIRTHHKTSLPNKDTYDVLHPSEFRLIKKYPEAEVLDPNTYYQARLMNPTDKLEINQKIKAVMDGSEAWMV